MRRAFILACGILLAMSSTGCFAVANLDHFESAANRDLVFHLRGMVPHRSQMMEIELINEAGNLQSWARIDPLGTEDFDLVMPKALAVPPYHIDFYADAMKDGLTDFTPGTTPEDHQWRVDVPLSGETTFTHNTNFNRLGAVAAGNGDGTVTVEGIPVGPGGLADHIIEARVIEAATGRTRVLVRHGSISAASTVLTAPGVFDLETAYNCDVWIDGNGNGRYDPPGPAMTDDHAFRAVVTTTTSTSVTATIPFSLDAQTDVAF